MLEVFVYDDGEGLARPPLGGKWDLGRGTPLLMLPS